MHIYKTFQQDRALLAVIHSRSNDRDGLDTLLTSVGNAVAGGADGIFLIDQHASLDFIIGTALPAVRERFPNFWIGLNPLAASNVYNAMSMAKLHGLNGLWRDDAGVDGRTFAECVESAHATISARQLTRWNGLYFGGTAFKTQRKLPLGELPYVVRMAAMFTDVVTTSGDWTAVAAELERIKLIRNTMDRHVDLAIASGITVENVKDYLPYANAFIVGTGIESAFGVIDPERVCQLANLIHRYGAGGELSLI